jgi:hypothetical protein
METSLDHVEYRPNLRPARPSDRAPERTPALRAVAARGGRVSSLVSRVAAIVVTALAVVACAPRAEPPPEATATEWREFDGTWNAAGTRRTIHLGDGRTSSIVELRGTMLLAGPGRPGVGFLAETVAFVDSASGLVGRSVWTDERGDRVFSELMGEGTAANNRLEGTVVGGTGRYAGATGAYTFSWQYVVEAEDGAIQGRAVGLKGRVRIGPAPSGGQP